VRRRPFSRCSSTRQGRDHDWMDLSGAAKSVPFYKAPEHRLSLRMPEQN
jgi:hypothetical protein